MYQNISKLMQNKGMASIISFKMNLDLALKNCFDDFINEDYKIYNYNEKTDFSIRGKIPFIFLKGNRTASLNNQIKNKKKDVVIDIDVLSNELSSNITNKCKASNTQSSFKKRNKKQKKKDISPTYKHIGLNKVGSSNQAHKVNKESIITIFEEKLDDLSAFKDNLLKDSVPAWLDVKIKPISV
jgi:hypothetical protein